MSLQTRSTQWRSWLQLIRLPNLLTVPGDPLAGACLVLALRGSDQLWPALWAALIALALYAAGLILNDCMDLEEDRLHRPKRPLPSGEIPLVQAATAAVLLLLLGLGGAIAIGPATATIAALLTGTILLYNRYLKNIPLLGSLSMGLCRGLSLMLGATAVGAPPIPSGLLLAAALLLVLYIAAVTTLAAREHQAIGLGLKRWLPYKVLLLLMLLLLITARDKALFSLLPALIAITECLKITRALRGVPEPQVVQASIGSYIRLLILVQASLCFVQFPIGTTVGVLLILLWPLSCRLGRWFYAS
ncbi:MAG: UbiA family prenyltransferase [Lentisphaerae bacterium]|nr:UbiA family prenyltransferase [Lentisphaerota bacterium]